MELSTVAQTVIGGVLVFVVGQIFLKSVIEPIHQLKRTFADISHIFVSHSHYIHNPDAGNPEDIKEVFIKLRELSGRIHADMALIPLYGLFRFVFCLPGKKNVYEASTRLIAVGNWMYSKNDNKFDHIIYNVQTACDQLGLYIDPKDRVEREHLNLP